MGRTFQSGIISRLVVGGGTYAVLHNETQIDVDNSNGLSTIIKLQPIDPSLGQCTVYINDYGNNSSIGNITIVASAGNLINGQPTLVLDTDGIGAEISVSDQRNFIASLNNDSQSTGGLTTADNGLTVFGTNVQLGGNLVLPTTIDALGSNTFSINDQAGLMFKTRDSLGNFFFNNIGGTGTLVGSSQYIFSYLGDGGNVFTDSLIVINFGGANTFTNAVDFWNFGDYTQANTSSAIFNIGRFNHFDNVSSTTVIGYSNDLNACSSLSVYGTGNTVNGVNDKFIIGNNNKNLFVDGITGYVGINEINPQGMLNIKSTGSGTAGIIIDTDSTQDAKILFATNNAVTKRAKIWVDDSTQTFNFYTVNNDTIFYNGNGLAQVKTLTLFTNTSAKFETVLSIGKTPTSTTLDVQGDALSLLFKLNNSNFLFADKLRVGNNGDFYSGSINAFGGFGQADFTTDHLNYKFNTSYQTYLAFSNSQGAGNKGGYGIIGSNIANADSDYRLVVLNNDAGTLGSVIKAVSTATNNANDGFDYTNHVINILSNGIFTNSGAGIFYKTGLNINITNGDVNRAINVENGVIRVVKANQPAYITLSSGDFYYDTAANILANGDFVVGMKA